MTPQPIFSIVLFGFGAFLLIWPGYAILYALGFGRHRWEASFFAGPPLTLAILTVVFSGSAWTGFHLSAVAGTIWCFLMLLALAGILAAIFGAKPAMRPQSVLWLLAAGIPILIMPSILWFGLSIFANSALPDGWSYLAMADSLIHNARLDEGGLSPLHQYASHLMFGRNATPAILAGISILMDLRPDQVLTPYCLLIVFANCCGLIVFAKTAFNETRQVSLYVSLAAITAPALILFFANIDQLLVLPFLPVIAALSIKARTTTQSRPASILAGLLVSAAIYAYIELVFVAILTALSFVALYEPPIRTAWARIKEYLIGTTIVAVILASPGIDQLFASLAGQFAITKAAIRPGDNFLETAWFRVSRSSFIYGTALPLSVCAALASIIGLFTGRTRWLSCTALVSTFVILVYYVFFAKYLYAAYKVATINCWLLGYFVALGISTIAQRATRLNLDTAAYRAATIASLIFSFLVSKSLGSDMGAIAERQASFREALKIEQTVKSAPTLLAVRDAEANQWAVYYLSHTFLMINPLRVYMAQAHVIPLMMRAKTPRLNDIRFIVTDRDNASSVNVENAHLVWSGKLYSLWKTDGPNWFVSAIGGIYNDDIKIGGGQPK